jgi:hypothetical protein
LAACCGNNFAGGKFKQINKHHDYSSGPPMPAFLYGGLQPTIQRLEVQTSAGPIYGAEFHTTP